MDNAETVLLDLDDVKIVDLEATISGRDCGEIARGNQ